ncbi:hypothetical protein PHLGIDRAFT_145519 [Phlebiopsis gigantea 11061_1 CR5-6]|uniref:Uncharacterized protein n=1 Tax=Phlebiopsis gigantea (strain 11061_1 CR5-6) TaxID=745531 RepID=A0A0C3S5J0_PHLG1|nr:hypothetical protein PHLGIDRAFT_145519 [Phlebiopsis gigantea 11061_1 CR5-6]
MSSSSDQDDFDLDKEVVNPELARELPSAASMRSPASQSSWSLFVICVFMHIFLTGLHLTLLVLGFKLQDHSFTVSDDRLNAVTGTIFDYVTLSPNVIIKIYLVPLLFVTQKLALRKDLHLEQSLTAMHDKSRAWLSLGATSVTLWRYRSLLSLRQDRGQLPNELKAMGTILCVLLYFIGGIALTILAPDLMLPGNIVGDKTSFQRLTSYISNIGSDRNQIAEAFPIVDIIPLLLSEQDVSTTGLTGNLVYDIPNFATDGDVHTNGVIFDAICQAVPDVVQSGDPSEVNSTYPLHVHDQLADIHVAPSSRTLNLRSTVWANASTDAPPPAVMLLASTIPVLDDAGLSGTSASLDPQAIPTRCTVPSDCSSVSSIQVIACNVNLIALPQQVQVFTDVFPLATEYNQSLDVRSSEWVNWTLPDAPTNPGLFSIGSFGDLAPVSHTAQFYTIEGFNVTANDTLTMLEDNLMEALGYYRDDVHSINLGDLEGALEQAISAVYWRAAARAVNDNQTLDNDEFDFDVKYSVTISRKTTLIAFTVSLAMTVLAIVLTIPQKTKVHGSPGTRVDGLGVLELTWLLGRDKDGLADRLGEVENPTLVHLREAGKRIPVAFCG